MRAVLMLLLVGMAGAVQAQGTPRACAWLVEPTYDRENILFPELTTRYLGAIIPAVPGGYVEVTGEFPHARYMSLQTYSSTLQSLSNLPDIKILPDEGSINPFHAGADRNAATRKYTVRVVFNAPPESGPEPNTLYYQSSDGVTNGRVLVYRIYLPDAAALPFGGVPVPALTEVLPGGLRIPIPECPELLPDTSFLSALLAKSGASDYPLPPIGLWGREQPEWHRYVNAPTGYTDMFTNTEILGPLNDVLRPIALQLPAGLGENADNKYVYTGLSREFGQVALIRAKMPATPRTYLSEPVMQDAQLRFWSMCIGNRASMAYDCLVDQNVPLDQDGYFSIAITTDSNRPLNATPECGIGWLPWGPDVITSVIMRNMLPSEAFYPQSVQASDQGTEKDTLGPYYPSVTYYPTVAEFETAVGCHAPAYLPQVKAAAPASDAKSTAWGAAFGQPLLVLVAMLALMRRRMPD